MEFFATAGSLPLHIRDSRVGEQTIVLIHGYLETMYIWNDFYDSLSKNYRVILIDAPGHGLSSSFPVNTMDDIATVVNDVLDICKVEKAIIGGHSMGGFISQCCVKKYPERFTKLILFNSHPYIDPVEKKEDREREINIINSGKLDTIAALSIPKMYHPDNLRDCDDKIRETIEICETHDPQGVISSIKGMMLRDSSEELLEISPLPILMITGDTDSFMPLERINKMKEQFPKISIVTIPNSGHNSFIEKEQETLEIVCDFITRENC